MHASDDSPIDTFDYIVIGAGAAGAIIAHRLAQQNVTVCLLEAGPPDRHPFLQMPSGFGQTTFSASHIWAFHTKPSEHTNNRDIPIPLGRTLGGSTSISSQIYNRGQHEDFNDWAELGNTGWSFDEVLPYFKRTEHFMAGINAGSSENSRWHGRNGELPVCRQDYIHPLCEAFIEGAKGLGIPFNPDYNGATQEGVGYFQRIIDDGQNISTARVFLQSTKNQNNLDIRTQAFATELIIKRRRVIGVRYCRGKNLARQKEVHARKEVIISCGAVNTPKLLQLSGIGPGSLLQQRGIPVHHALAGIGEHLSDHFSVQCVAHVKNISTINDLYRPSNIARQALRWLRGRPNVLSLNPSLVHIFWKSSREQKRSDLQGFFVPASYRNGYTGTLDKHSGMSCGFMQQRPWSIGHVRVRSRDPFEHPEIQPNYLSDERDRLALMQSVRLARRLLRTAPLQAYFNDEALPGEQAQSDSDLLGFMREHGSSAFALNGTARMGNPDDPLAVVDSALKVIGLKGLRIADASVMPRIPSADIGAATMMIAEKAADLILADRNNDT